ncbi:hypothetical protein GOV04_02350 [Candidatus Woesearchaeota archaeon]|nr:hypothetical protein [Candidatus Woesearchaeota archaeon]
MYKKAQGISMNMIIIAAIALLVLVITSIIFIGRMSGTTASIESCTNKAGMCGVVCGSEDAGTANYPFQYNEFKCPDASDGTPQQCCLQLQI